MSSAAERAALRTPVTMIDRAATAAGSPPGKEPTFRASASRGLVPSHDTDLANMAVPPVVTGPVSSVADGTRATDIGKPVVVNREVPIDGLVLVPAEQRDRSKSPLMTSGGRTMPPEDSGTSSPVERALQGADAARPADAPRGPGGPDIPVFERAAESPEPDRLRVAREQLRALLSNERPGSLVVAVVEEALLETKWANLGEELRYKGQSQQNSEEYQETDAQLARARSATELRVETEEDVAQVAIVKAHTRRILDSYYGDLLPFDTLPTTGTLTGDLQAIPHRLPEEDQDIAKALLHERAKNASHVALSDVHRQLVIKAEEINAARPLSAVTGQDLAEDSRTITKTAENVVREHASRRISISATDAGFDGTTDDGDLNFGPVTVAHADGQAMYQRVTLHTTTHDPFGKQPTPEGKVPPPGNVSELKVTDIHIVDEDGRNIHYVFHKAVETEMGEVVAVVRPEQSIDGTLGFPHETDITGTAPEHWIKLQNILDTLMAGEQEMPYETPPPAPEQRRDSTAPPEGTYEGMPRDELRELLERDHIGDIISIVDTTTSPDGTVTTQISTGRISGIRPFTSPTLLQTYGTTPPYSILVEDIMSSAGGEQQRALIVPENLFVNDRPDGVLGVQYPNMPEGSSFHFSVHKIPEVDSPQTPLGAELQARVGDIPEREYPFYQRIPFPPDETPTDEAVARRTARGAFISGTTEPEIAIQERQNLSYNELQSNIGIEPEELRIPIEVMRTYYQALGLPSQVVDRIIFFNDTEESRQALAEHGSLWLHLPQSVDNAGLGDANLNAALVAVNHHESRRGRIATALHESAHMQGLIAIAHIPIPMTEPGQEPQIYYESAQHGFIRNHWYDEQQRTSGSFPAEGRADLLERMYMELMQGEKYEIIESNGIMVPRAVEPEDEHLFTQATFAGVGLELLIARDPKNPDRELLDAILHGPTSRQAMEVLDARLEAIQPGLADRLKYAEGDGQNMIEVTRHIIDSFHGGNPNAYVASHYMVRELMKEKLRHAAQS